MNWQARIVGLMLLSALTFSCEEDINTIGLPPENNLGIFFADVPLADYISQVWVGDIVTGSVTAPGNAQLLVGAYTDPNFGEVSASSYFELIYNNVPIDETAVFDSAFIELRVNFQYGINADGMLQEFELYQLDEPINIYNVVDGDSTIRRFQTEDELPIDLKLADLSFNLETDSIGLSFGETGIDLNDGIDDATDSAYYEANFDSNDFYRYILKTKLSDKFGADIINSLKVAESPDANDFADFSKGIHIRPSSTNSAILTFLTNNSDNIVKIYYTEENDDGNPVSKTVSYRFSNNRSFNNITPNVNSPWTGSDFDGITQYNVFETFDNAYIQAGTGLLTKIDLEPFRTFRDTLNNPILQGAQLVISGVNSNVGSLAPPQQILFNLTSLDSLADGSYRESSVPQNTSSNPLTAIYNSDNDQYIADIPLFLTLFLQDEDFEFNQIVISPSGLGTSLSRAVFNKDNVRLRIYYTLPDKNQ